MQKEQRDYKHDWNKAQGRKPGERLGRGYYN